MAYELEQFGIKVILIEPGVIKTNFDNNLKIGKNVSATTNDYSSPYAEITEKRIAGFKPRFKNGLSPMELAKSHFKCRYISKYSIRIRYLAGNDALKLMEIRKNKSDKEFRRLVMEGVMK
jgi:short-subunit dehydrogenase